MKNNAYELWDTLEQTLKMKNTGVILKNVYQDKYMDMFFQADKLDNLVLYIHFNVDEDNAINEDLNGISIKTELRKDIDRNKEVVIIRNKDTENNILFKAFTATLFSNVKENTSYSYDMILKTIDDYKDYFDGKHRKLDKLRQQGLFGELTYILSQLDNSDGNIIKFWEGANANKHDFVFNDHSVEVKTTRNQTRLDVKISNENQLDNSQCNTLYLKLYRLEEVEVGKSVYDLYLSISNRLNYRLKSLFEAKLIQVGLDLSGTENYAKFRIDGEYNYLVDDKFPKIVKSNLPENVFGLKYNINLDGYPERGMDNG